MLFCVLVCNTVPGVDIVVWFGCIIGDVYVYILLVVVSNSITDVVTMLLIIVVKGRVVVVV